ncbi:MAG: sigma-70 family RNA polymerase sigma factor [Firmicutes bacterium]|nr:sigma-70 family RNA polymerase sigma factor [Bacillota bacterium]
MGNSVKKGSDSFITNDIYQDFLREIHQYPVLSDEETLVLIGEAQSGNEWALDRLVKHNLRLVASVARNYQHKISNLQIMDLIQEGTLGFINAIKKYDEEKSKLSTYGIIWIKQAIERSLINKEDSIRKTVNFATDKNRYLKFIQEYFDDGQPLPNDEEICELLGITLNRLNLIRTSSDLIPISIATPSPYDSEKDLSEFIGSSTDDFKDIVNDFDTQRLLVVLKQVLTPIEYFVIYYHILFKDATTFKNISKCLGISRKRANQIEKQALSKIKPYMTFESPLFMRAVKRLIDQNIKIENVNVNPIEPMNIIKYMYVKKSLTDLEQKMLFLLFFGNFKYQGKKSIVDFDGNEDELLEAQKSLANKLHQSFSDTKRFKQYTKNMIKVYGTKIFDLININESESEEILDIDISKIMMSAKDLSPHEIDLIKKYLGLYDNVHYSKYEIERDVYLTVFGYKNKEAAIPLIKLYESYCKHKNKFTDEQQAFLEYFLCRKNLSVFLNKYPNSNLPNNYKFLIRKLEILYFNIDKLFDCEFSKDNYLFVITTFSNKVSPRRKQLLDLYYGVSGNALTIKEIALMLGEDYSKIRSEVFNAIEFLKNLFYGNSKELTIDFSVYIPFILDKKYEFTDETRNILKLYLIDKLSYENISEYTGLSRTKVTNLINDGLRRIDFYRFGLIQSSYIEFDALQELFDSECCTLTEVEKEMVVAKKCKNKNYEEIIKEFGLSKAKYDRVMTKFNDQYTDYLIKDVILTELDIQSEINKVSFDSVLSVDEKKLLSCIYGFTNKYNKGSKIKKSLLAKILCFSESAINEKTKKALNKIKLRKKSLLKPDLLYLSNDELNRILDDQHLPISEDAKIIICYLFGLKDFPLKTLEELSKTINTPTKQIKRTYQRAIVSIFKYLNNEIEGTLDYNIDIEPNLRFFSKRDLLLIIEHFKNKLTNQEISQKYGISLHIINRMIKKIKITLSDIVMHEEKCYFDFETYRELIDNPNLPYYGNLLLIKKCFELYTGESTMDNLSISEVIHDLGLSCNAETVRNHMTLLILSIYKLQRGIKKQTSFSDAVIREYYMRNQEEMSLHRLECFNRYLSGSTAKSEFTDDTEFVSDTIIFDLLKDQNPDFFDLENVTREEVWVLLKKYYNELNEGTRNALIGKFNLCERDFMIEEEKEKAFSLIRKLQSETE